jgi:hypothetical protein
MRGGIEPLMPQSPDASYAPDINLDDSRKWVLKLVGLDEQESRYRDKNPNAMMLVFKYLVYDVETGEAVIDERTGQPYEQWQFTSDATFDNPTTKKIAAAREIANALMGRRLSDDEIREMNEAGWEETLMNRTVEADLEWYQDSAGAQKLKVLRVKPYAKKSARPRRSLDDE